MINEDLEFSTELLQHRIKIITNLMCINNIINEKNKLITYFIYY